MEILFLILKIIGILLLILLLFVVALVAVPVRYRVNIKAQEEIEGKFTVHWLFHLFDVRVSYEEKSVSYKLRIFGIPISLEKKEKKKTQKEREETHSEDIQNAEVQALEVPVQEIQEEESQIQREEVQDTQEHIPAEEAKYTKEQSLETQKQEAEDKPEKTFRKNKKARKSGSSGKRFQNVRGKAAKVKNGTTSLKEQIENIKNLILAETNKKALSHVLREMRYLLGHYSPRKAAGTISFSMGAPDRTGKVLGGISVIPFWARYKVTVMPDFVSESFYVKGNVSVKGHIRAGHLLISGIRLLKDKNIRKLITNIRQ
ncbi:MAG: hypothetical protein HFH41_12835 [Lachnospiraceae bacterium]|nr:hypothetical protein [Lachnospiraceae bacterium]